MTMHFLCNGEHAALKPLLFSTSLTLPASLSSFFSLSSPGLSLFAFEELLDKVTYK